MATVVYCLHIQLVLLYNLWVGIRVATRTSEESNNDGLYVMQEMILLYVG